MFTCAKIKDGSTYLSSHLSANDYYCKNEHVSGHWIGKGAERLGLGGNAIEKDDAAFEALRKNMLPDGSGRLTPRRAENGVRFFDFQCSAQKSVSIMAVTLDDQRLIAAHDNAAAIAFAELERFSAYRSGLSRQPQITGALCAAAFRHDASRALDPQLHTHFVVANATWDPDRKRWFALDTCEMFRAIRYAGKVYQNELAFECRRLGYPIESVRNEKGVVEGFEIKGVPTEIRERFSKRRAEVEAGIEAFRRRKGRAPTTREIHVITRETRNIKLKEITTPEVRTLQRSQLSEREMSELEKAKKDSLAGAGEKLWMGSNWRSLMHACKHIYERQSVVRGHQIIAEALNHRLGHLDLSTIKRYMTSAHNGLVRLAEQVRNPLLSCQWTSRRGLQLEHWSVEFVNQTRGSCKPLGKTEGVAFDFKSEEQKQVVLEALKSIDRVYAIRGCAGAGKTTSLREIRKGLEASGRTVFYLAPTASAVEVLKADGFTRATTVDDFLVNREKLADIQNSVIIIDESSLQSTEMGNSILRIAQAQDARVLFVGDVRQHASVEAGDFLRVLEQHSNLGRSELKDIRRQLPAEYNSAIRSMSQGNVLGGMKQLDELGWVQEAKGQYVRQAADAYLGATSNGRDLDRCIAISPTWEENHRFTDAIREGLKERKLLKDGIPITVHDQLDWTLQQKSDVSNYRAGMVLTFNSGVGPVRRGQTFDVDRIERGRVWLKALNRSIDVNQHSKKFAVSLPRTVEICQGEKILIRHNSREHGLVNGHVLTVTCIRNDGSLETKEGKLLPPEFRHFCHGYVVTSHKSQARTHDHVVVAAEQLDSKAAYVACSRGRKQAQVFTPEKEHLFERLERPADRPAALDVIGASRKAFWSRTEQIAWKSAKENAALFPPAMNPQKAHGLEMDLE